MSLSNRPYYQPREIPKIFLNVIYIPDSASGDAATAQLTDLLNDQLHSAPNSVVIVTGDFNHAELNPALPFYQHVTQPTRDGATLDLCYTNINKAYKSSLLPPLGLSAHDMVYLLPNYKSKLIKTPVVEKTVRVWDQSGRDKFSDCLEMTDWNVFIDTCNNLDELYDHVSCYINFCEDNCFSEKTVKIFKNSKPWVTKEMKCLLNERKKAFKERNIEKGKIIQSKIKTKINECKQAYREKVEEKFRVNDTKGMWSGVKQMIGFNDKETKISIDKGKEQEYTNNLNAFYSRFDSNDFSGDIKNIKSHLSTNNDEFLQIENYNVIKLFKSLKPGKACGPDNMKPIILKTFAHELSEIFTYMFNLSLQSNIVPTAWKTSKIIPVPKSKTAKEMNDFRPVALTSVPMKCLEKLY